MAQYAFGGGSLWTQRTDISGAPPVKFGALQDVSCDFGRDLKGLSGVGVVPLALGGGKMKIELKAKFANVSGRLYNDIFFGQALSTGQNLVADGEAGSIPTGVAYTVTVANAAKWIRDLGVRYASTGQPLTQVSANPTVGQYTVAAGVYTFAAADEGLAVYIDYEYASTTGSLITLTNVRMGAIPTFSLVCAQIFGSQQIVLTFNNVSCSKLDLPSKQDDWLISELDFMVAADAGGNIGTISFAQ